jgi:hypothetical protein
VVGVGNALHFDGPRWSAVPSGTVRWLQGVYASRADDVWAVGLGGVIVHFDGHRFSEVVSSLGVNLQAVVGFKDGDVVIAGANGAILRRSSPR